MKLQISPSKRLPNLEALLIPFLLRARSLSILHTPTYSKKLIKRSGIIKSRKYYFTDDLRLFPSREQSIHRSRIHALHFYPIPTDLFQPLYPATAVANRRQCGIGISFRAKRRARSSFFPSPTTPSFPPSLVVPRRDCVRLVHARATRGGEGGRVHEKRKKGMGDGAGRYRNKLRQDLITISRGA